MSLNQRQMMRWCVLAAFIIFLLAFAGAGIALAFLAGNPAFLGLCSPLLLAMMRAILGDLFPNPKSKLRK